MRKIPDVSVLCFMFSNRRLIFGSLLMSPESSQVIAFSGPVQSAYLSHLDSSSSFTIPLGSSTFGRLVSPNRLVLSCAISSHRH